MAANPYTILIVEDENSIAGFMGTILTANHYDVLKAKDAAEAMMLITSRCPDAVLLDLGLPDTDGLEVIRSVRSWSDMPIIVVSARTHEREKVQALDLGADDYITKPFGTSELLARLRTALRHSAKRGDALPPEEGIFRAGELSVDYSKRRAYLGERDVNLTQNEFRIISLLSRYAGRVLTYDFILKAIWGPNMSCDNQILRVNLANIRRKIEKNPADPEYVFTEMGVGYRMIEGD